jgi:hypothetical protein
LRDVLIEFNDWRRDCLPAAATVAGGGERQEN